MMTTADSIDAIEKKNVLLLTSCLYPPNLLRQRLAYKMMDKMAEVITSEPDRSINYTLLVAGDSIYADASAGLLDPTDPRERFEQSYRRLQATPSWQQLSVLIHNRLHTIDDHEIIDNWEPSCNESSEEIDESSNTELMEKAKHHFLNFISPELDIEENDAADSKLWGRQLIEGVNIFLMDTRTEREPRCVGTHTTAKMVSDLQMADLLSWLDELHQEDAENPKLVPLPKFIMSGSMPLPRRASRQSADEDSASVLRSDSWEGYPRTRNTLLAHIAGNGIRNVIFLSGDEHLPNSATIELTNAKDLRTTVHALHAAPLYAPLPFANSAAWMFSKSDHFTFSAPDAAEKISTDIDAQFPLIGNGFLRIVVSSKRPTEISVEFIGDKGLESAVLVLSQGAEILHA